MDNYELRLFLVDRTKKIRLDLVVLKLTLIIRAAMVASEKSRPNDRNRSFLSLMNGKESNHDRRAVN